MVRLADERKDPMATIKATAMAMPIASAIERHGRRRIAPRAHVKLITIRPL